MWLPPKAVLPSRLNMAWQEWPSCSDWLGGHILSLSWELCLQCSQGCSLDLYSSWLAAQLYIPILIFILKCENPSQAAQSLCFGHNLPTAARGCWRRVGEQHHEDVSAPAGNFCTVPSLEGNGTMPILLLTVAQRRWQSCSYLLSKMDMLAGATAWAKPVGMWAATLHACPGSCASSPPPWPHTAPVIAALSPALGSSFVLSAGGRFVLMAGWLMCLSSMAVKSLGRWGMSNLYCATARWAQHQAPTRAWPCSGSVFNLTAKTTAALLIYSGKAGIH